MKGFIINIYSGLLQISVIVITAFGAFIGFIVGSAVGDSVIVPVVIGAVIGFVSSAIISGHLFTQLRIKELLEEQLQHLRGINKKSGKVSGASNISTAYQAPKAPTSPQPPKTPASSQAQKATDYRTCPQCKNPTPKGEAVCTNCGYQVITFQVRVIRSNGQPVKGSRVLLAFHEAGRANVGPIFTDSEGYATFSNQDPGEADIIVDGSTKTTENMSDGKVVDVTI